MAHKERNVASSGDSRTGASPAEQLGCLLRHARRERGKGKWTLAWVGSKIGRSRVWLNRVELGYAKDGAAPLPTDADLAGLAQLLDLDLDELLQLRNAAEQHLMEAGHRRQRPTRRSPAGRRAQAEVFRGDENVYRAALELLERQSSGARLKVTHVVTLHPDPEGFRPYQQRYVAALAEFLDGNHRTASLERVVHAPTSQSIEMVAAKTAALAGNRPADEVHNIDTRFAFANPVLLDVLIGEREALIAIPDHRGHPALTAGVVISDVAFVEALRTWYHEIVWKSPGVAVDYTTAHQTFAELGDRLGPSKPA